MVEWILLAVLLLLGVIVFCYLISYPIWKIRKLIEKELEKRRRKGAVSG